MKKTRAQWQAVIILCKKCSKKLDGGFDEKGGDEKVGDEKGGRSLARALRARGKGGKGRKASIGVVETGCLKICPKNAVVAMNGARPEEWVIVPKGMDVDGVMERLGIGGGVERLD